jgi:YVTN family beta-propeller protein
MVVVDTAALTVTSVITGVDYPWGVVADPTGRRVYVTSQGSGAISVIESGTDSLVATWPIVGAEWLADVDISMDGRRLYVADAEMGDVYVIDTATGALLTTTTGTGDGWTAWEVEAFPSAAGPFTYATFPHDGWIGVLNTTSNTLEKVLLLENSGVPRGMALFPQTWLCRQVYLPLISRNY